MLELEWTPLDNEDLLMRLADVLVSWNRTPYREGQQCKGYGTDCVRFVCGVLDELQGTKTPIKTLPQDASLHAPELARASMRKIMTLFGPYDKVEDGKVQPGDILVTGPRNGGPGHAMIVGFQRNTIWEATSPCVRRIGWSIEACLHNKLYHVIRVRDRETRWAKTPESC